MKKSILTFAGAMLCCFLWGSAFPVIKIGYQLWNIDEGDTWSIVAFAGIRFFLAGVLVIIISSFLRKQFLFPHREELGKIFILSSFQTIGQYIFFYIGIAHTTGVNSAVVDSLTTFFAIIIASLVFRMEALTFRKILGCILGFVGVLIINFSGESVKINLLGDGLVMLSALCYGVSSTLIKRYSVEHDTVLFSGYQFMMGGLTMFLVSIPFDRLSVIKNAFISGTGSDQNMKAAVVLLYLALVSSIAYTLWGILLRTNDVSKISIYGFMNPVFGVILSALLLGEGLGLRYVAALIFIALGITSVNYRKGPVD